MQTIVPHPLLVLLTHHAWNPPPSSSLAEEERLRSLVQDSGAPAWLRTEARDSRRSQHAHSTAFKRWSVRFQ